MFAGCAIPKVHGSLYSDFVMPLPLGASILPIYSASPGAGSAMQSFWVGTEITRLLVITRVIGIPRHSLKTYPFLKAMLVAWTGEIFRL